MFSSLVLTTGGRLRLTLRDRFGVLGVDEDETKRRLWNYKFKGEFGVV
jgi:hypothetical protein